MRKDREGIMAQITKVRVLRHTPLHCTMRTCRWFGQRPRRQVDAYSATHARAAAGCVVWQPEVEKQNIRRVVLKTKTFAQNIDADVKADESSATYVGHPVNTLV